MASKETTITQGRRFGPLFFYVILYLLFLYIPSLMLPIFSFNDSIQMVLPLKDFTVRWYLEIPHQQGLLPALGGTVLLNGRLITAMTRAAIARAVAFVLALPGVFLNSSSDARLLPAILEAANRLGDGPDESAIAADVDRLGMQPLFVPGGLETI